MPLNWNEIRQRAITFSRDWEDESKENAEAQSFWNDFFEVFGKKRRHVAAFEAPVKGITGSSDRIDLLWPGTMIAEHKSRGKPLDKAETQAFGYVQSLVSTGREDEAPRFICVSDFASIAVHDLDEGTSQIIPVADLHEHIHAFDFIAGYQRRVLDPEDPANIKAAEMLAALHDALQDGGYPEHDLERFMVRILFCMFAEDTFVFEQPRAFEIYIKEMTAEDGSDLGPKLARWFEVLNTPQERRQKNIDERLVELPYINGDLYAGRLPFADFDSTMRKRLLDCCAFHWDTISPAVFGSLFQSIMDPRERREIGAHYTSERDIQKLIGSLFMDELRAELEKAKHDKNRLRKLHDRLGEITVLDPACGCGNFLVIAYRELRKLEIEILLRLHPVDKQQVFDVRQLLRVDVDQFFGIEIEEWPTRIAEVAMWLMDHQMNLEVSRIFGEQVIRLPLEKSARVVCGNALRMDWNDVLPAERCSYVLGNPPFIGHHLQTKQQKEDQNNVWSELSAKGVLDYVTNWYRIAAEYTKGTDSQCAFVSTNSISQGEQPGIFWPLLLSMGVQIHFAHRTFKWESEARGKAHVHVVIIGFGFDDISPKTIWAYDGDDGNKGSLTTAKLISPYLFEGTPRVLDNRRAPICAVPGMRYGNKPTDGGNFLLTSKERNELLEASPEAETYIRRYIGAADFLNGSERYCLWLPEIEPAKLRMMPQVLARVQAVREFRLASKAESTRKYADYPTHFRQIAHTDEPFILIPRHTSETRRYIPFAYYGPEIIPSDACFFIPGAKLYHFGVISSFMHMSWVRQFAGRIKSDYRYSKDIVYNNFPWPEDVADDKKAMVEAAAQGVLDARENHSGSTLADLYDPLTMPADLAKAHAALDRAVDRCYRSQPFPDDRRRVEFLFAMWERLTSPITAPAKKPRKKKA